MRGYFESIQTSLIEIIESGENRKDDILELASNFVIQAEVEGFPRRHTYYIVQKFLISPLKYEKSIDCLFLLREFFSAFSKIDRKFDSAFLVNRSVSNYPDLLERFGFKCSDEAPDCGELSKSQRLFVDSKSPDQVWLVAEKLKVHTPAAAHEEAKSMFDDMASVIMFFEHTSSVALSRLSLTIDSDSRQVYILHEAPDPMHCWVGNIKYSPADSTDISDAIHGGHLEFDSAIRLARALRFHKTALISNSAENQLIDLWAALEGLLPMPKRDGVRIDHFVQGILPVLRKLCKTSAAPPDVRH